MILKGVLARQGKARFEIKVVVCIVVLAVAFGHGFSVYAATRSDYLKQKQQLAVQAEAARKQAVEKQREADEMQRQLAIIDQKIQSIESALASTQSQIADTERHVEELNSQIKIQQDELAIEKAKMEKILSSWYMDGNKGLLTTMIGTDTISQAVTDGQYYETVQQQIRMEIDRIDAIKKDLDAKKVDQDRSLSSLQELKAGQDRQQGDLESQKASKQRLLSDTKNAIVALNAQAAAADRAQRDVQSKLSALSGTQQWGTDIVSDEDLSWYYSQLDYPGVMLGNSNASVAAYGCLVTSIAMVATHYGHHISPPDIARNAGIFSMDGSLMVSSPPGIGVTIQASQPINWSVINSELAAGRPVIVGLYLPSVGAINADGSSHYVVTRQRNGGQYLMHDPLGSGRGYSLSQVRSMKLITP